MKKQIDLSGLHTSSLDQLEEDKQSAKKEERRALNCHFLLNPVGNQYYTFGSLPQMDTAHKYSALGRMDIANPPIQNRLHQECRKIIQKKNNHD